MLVRAHYRRFSSFFLSFYINGFNYSIYERGKQLNVQNVPFILVNNSLRFVCFMNNNKYKISIK